MACVESWSERVCDCICIPVFQVQSTRIPDGPIILLRLRIGTVSSYGTLCISGYTGILLCRLYPRQLALEQLEECMYKSKLLKGALLCLPNE
jgi:hypothetical protein